MTIGHRNGFPPPTGHSFSRKYVTLNHPGYKPAYAFLSLPCLDVDGEDGVLFGVVQDAAFVVANNFSGVFKLDPNGDAIGEKSRDGLLAAGEYYYFRDDWDQPSPYPICVQFKQWTPPTLTSLPEAWKTMTYSSGTSTSRLLNAPDTWSERSQAVKDTDGMCLCTKQRSGLNASHLLPRAESTWFDYHRLRHSALGIAAGDPMKTESTSNLVTMRSDIIGDIFNKRHFVIVPIQGRTSLYFLRYECDDHIYAFHRICVDVPNRVASAFLFYRFAWSVIGLAKRFSPHYEAHLVQVAVPSDFENFEKTMSGPGSKRRRTNNPSEPSETSTSNPPIVNPKGIPTALRTQILDNYLVFAEQKDQELTERIGPELDETNLHKIADQDLDKGQYPGFSHFIRLKADYFRSHPSVRSSSGEDFAQGLGETDDEVDGSEGEDCDSMERVDNE